MPKKITSILFLFFITFISISDCSAKVTIDLVQSGVTYQAGKIYPINFRTKIAESWYIHGIGKSSEYLIPTTLSFEETPSIKILKIRFPEPEKKIFNYTKKIEEVYSGEILIKALLSIDDGVEPGEHLIKGSLAYQACSDKLCMPPETLSIKIKLHISPEDALSGLSNPNNDILIINPENSEQTFSEKLMGRGFFFSILIFFLAGLGLNLTPCIYPLIPITVSYFGGKSQDISGNSLLHGGIYIFGIAITNSFLGVSASLSGSMIGSALQNPLTLVFVTIVLLVLGSSFFGFWEFRIPMGIGSLLSGNYKGYFGTFFMGLTLGIVAVPCIGPFIIGLLTYLASEGDPYKGFINFFALSVGMGLPVSILAVFTGSIDRLPLSGGWMLWIKKIMGWIMFIMAAYMISPVISGYGTGNLPIVIVSLFAGIHLGWLDKSGNEFRIFVKIKRISGALVIFCCLIYLMLFFWGKNGVEWVSYTPDIMKKANQQKTPLIIDFYADWCEPCREMEKTIFRDPDIVEQSRNLIPLKVDLTRRNPFQDEVLRNYGVIGVPTLIFINKEGKEERKLRIEGLAKKADVLENIRHIASH